MGKASKRARAKSDGAAASATAGSDADGPATPPGSRPVPAILKKLRIAFLLFMAVRVALHFTGAGRSKDDAAAAPAPPAPPAWAAVNLEETSDAIRRNHGVLATFAGPWLPFEVLEKLPHDATAFTQGLAFGPDDGAL